MCMLIKAGFSSSDGLNDHDWHKPYDLNDRNICGHLTLFQCSSELRLLCCNFFGLNHSTF